MAQVSVKPATQVYKAYVLTVRLPYSCSRDFYSDSVVSQLQSQS